MQPSGRQLGNQRLDTAFSHLGDVGVATCAPRRVIGYRGRVHQYQTLEALQLPSNELERDIATERETDQREARRRICEQLFGHSSQRIVVAEGEHLALVVGLKRGDLRSVQPLVRQMGASDGEERTSKHTSIRAITGSLRPRAAAATAGSSDHNLVEEQQSSNTT